MKMRDHRNLNSNNSAGQKHVDDIFDKPNVGAAFSTIVSTQGEFNKWQQDDLYSTIGTAIIGDSIRRSEQEYLRKEFTLDCRGGAYASDRPTCTQKYVGTGRFQDMHGRNETLNTNDSGRRNENALHSGGRHSHPECSGKTSDAKVQLVMDCNATFYQIAGDSLSSMKDNITEINRHNLGDKKITREITRNSPASSRQIRNGRRKFTLSICSWWAFFFFNSHVLQALAQEWTVMCSCQMKWREK
ncbi:hypothetical protein SKAU_G00128580 [Synaphobranchus kaupii]|uniref:Uncharacterized protein n=1 Tax=Synaphobranchus kaupii TaxID=118154 RepID=A0A9Q1FQ36_SYNKA|nr:hypothetical protein SKAU_G00128580 [Synaphobranchus kaupii]